MYWLPLGPVPTPALPGEEGGRVDQSGFGMCVDIRVAVLGLITPVEHVAGHVRRAVADRCAPIIPPWLGAGAV
jgi:hypothetical protein